MGQVRRVFPLAAEVTLITDKEQSLPVQIQRNGLRTIAFGSPEPSSMELRFLPANADILNGDTVVTSGLDGMYPAGLPVATVAHVDRDVKDQFARVLLKPSAGMSNSRMLLVLMVQPPPLQPVAEVTRGSGATPLRSADRAGAKAVRK